MSDEITDTKAVKVEQLSKLLDYADPLNLSDRLVEPAPMRDPAIAPESFDLPPVTAEDVFRAQARAGAILHGSVRSIVAMVDMGVITDIGQIAAELVHYLHEWEITTGTVRNNTHTPF